MKTTLEPAINVYSKEELISRIAIVKNLAETIQFDVVDGKFATPQNYTDPQIIFNNIPNRKVHLHLMVENNGKEYNIWRSFLPKRVTFHVEIQDNLVKLIDFCKSDGIEAGIAIAPATSLDKLAPYIPYADFLLVVSVTPGKSGQKFFDNSLDRLRLLRKKYPEIKLGVDGGVGEENIIAIRETGVNSIAVGSNIFASKAPTEAYKRILLQLQS